MIGKNLIKGFDGHFEGAVSTLELRPRPSTCSCISSKDDHVFVVGLWIGTSSQYQMFEANLQIRYKMSKSLQRSSFSQGKRWDEDNFVGLICLSILTHKGYIKRLFWCNPCVWGWLRPTRSSATRRALSRTKFCEKFYLLGVHVFVVLRDLGDHLCPAACCITSKRLNIRHFEHRLSSGFPLRLCRNFPLSSFQILDHLTSKSSVILLANCNRNFCINGATLSAMQVWISGSLILTTSRAPAPSGFVVLILNSHPSLLLPEHSHKVVSFVPLSFLRKQMWTSSMTSQLHPSRSPSIIFSLVSLKSSSFPNSSSSSGPSAMSSSSSMSSQSPLWSWDIICSTGRAMLEWPVLGEYWWIWTISFKKLRQAFTFFSN